MSGNAPVGKHVARSCYQQDCFARANQRLCSLGHAHVAGNLDSGHGADLGFGQQTTVALPDRDLLRRQCLWAQAGVQSRVGHGSAHFIRRQVGTGNNLA